MSRMEIQALMSQYLMKCNLPIKQENLINERSTVWNPEKRNSANKILNSIICTHHRRRDQAPQREGNYGQALREKATMAKLSERRQLWPSSQREGNYGQALRRGHGPFQDASSMSTYLTICNLLFKQEI